MEVAGVYVLKRLINWVPHGLMLVNYMSCLPHANIAHTGSNSVDKVK